MTLLNICTSQPLGSTPPPLSLWDNLVAYWRMEEGGGSLSDSVAGVLANTFGTGQLYLQSGKSNFSVGAVNGSNSYARGFTCQDGVVNVLNTGPMTLSAWLLTAGDGGTIFPGFTCRQGASGTNWRLRIQRLPTQYMLSFQTSGGARTLVGPSGAGNSHGVWNHVVISTTDRSNYKFYVNGVMASGVISPSPLSDINNLSWPGLTTSSSPGLQLTDELGLWNRQLDDVEVDQLYASGFGTFY